MIHEKPLFLVAAFVAAALAGALNSVAGGGSFLTLPTLLFSGVPPVIANATSSVALWPAGIGSAYAYRKDMPTQRALTLTLAAASLIGGTTGGLLLLWTSDTTFVRLLPWLLLVATLLFTFGARLTARFRASDVGETRRSLVVVAGLQLAIATYGGYFGGGMGFMMLAAFALMGMTNIHSMNGLKTLLGTLINGTANLLFIVFGKVAWAPCVAMATGAMIGGYAGAAVARKLNPIWVKRGVIVIAWGMTVYFFAKNFRLV